MARYEICGFPVPLLLLLLLSPGALSSDPDPLQDYCVADLSASAPHIDGFPCKPESAVTQYDFFFDGLAKKGNTANKFGFGGITASVLDFPGLNTLGISMSRIDIASNGGVVPPHTHPRATEIIVVTEGRLLAGFLGSDDVYYSKELTVGEVFVIPEGAVHFQMNRGKGNASYFAAFNSQLPGTVMLPTNLFASNPSIPDDVLKRAFQITSYQIKGIRSKLRSRRSH